MKTTTFLITLLLAFAFNPVRAQQITFGFDSNTAAQNNVPNGTEVTETINGITVTISDTVDPFGGPDNITLIDGNGEAGTTGNIVSTGDTSTVTVTFSKAVDVHSLLVRDRNGGTLDLTFTPTGGSNTEVVVPLVNGLATNNIANLNWTEVTSFTVTSTGPVGEDYAFDDISVTPLSPVAEEILFDFDTNAVVNMIDDQHWEVAEEINGITITVKDALDSRGWSPVVLLQSNGYAGASGQYVSGGTTKTLTIAFSEAVHVHSLIMWDSIEVLDDIDADITFTPTGGSNVPVVISLVDGLPPSVITSLNWTDVTSFTITSIGPGVEGYGIDDVSVSAITLSTNDDVLQQTTKVYPNPVENTLNITNVSGLKSIIIYNNLGQFILQSKQDKIDVSHLSKGIYFLQIQTSQGVDTKRVVKK